MSKFSLSIFVPSDKLPKKLLSKNEEAEWALTDFVTEEIIEFYSGSSQYEWDYFYACKIFEFNKKNKLKMESFALVFQGKWLKNEKSSDFNGDTYKFLKDKGVTEGYIINCRCHE